MSLIYNRGDKRANHKCELSFLQIHFALFYQTDAFLRLLELSKRNAAEFRKAELARRQDKLRRNNPERQYRSTNGTFVSGKPFIYGLKLKIAGGRFSATG